MEEHGFVSIPHQVLADTVRGFTFFADAIARRQPFT